MMTEIPTLVIHCLNTHYLIKATAIILLPLGADRNASVYKVEAKNQKTYFVKIKYGHFDDTPLSLLKHLQKAGIKELIMPLKTAGGKDSYEAGDFTLIVYPFVDGQDGFTRSLSDEQWIALGRALRQVHEVDVPSPLKAHIPKEDFSTKWRDAVSSLYLGSDTLSFDDNIALDLWNFLQEHRSIIEELVSRSLELSKKVQNLGLKFVLCHSDIHAGNVFIDHQGALYIIDWDEPTLAPKERDLMFIGAGVGNVWNRPQEQELFYQGYGEVPVDQNLISYYRCNRILVDIFEYAQELLVKPATAKDRVEMYKQFMGMFEPNGVVDIALMTANKA